MKILFIMDPFDRVHPEKDTTFVLIEEARRRGFSPYFCEQRHLSLNGPDLLVKAAAIVDLMPSPRDATQTFARLGDATVMPVADFPLVFLRTDPPFDLRYVTTTYLLEYVNPQKTRVINQPTAVRSWTEKLSTLQFPDLIPNTIVSCDAQEIERFVDDVGGTAILKPLFRSGGAGIFKLDLADTNLRVILESSIDEGRSWVMVQRFLPEMRDGDKRVILVEGEPIGALLRRATASEHRSNIHVGGMVERTELTERDREICARVAPPLTVAGLRLVGLDLIGNYLTEINVTSPTGFQEINRLSGATGEHTMQSRAFDLFLAKLPKAG